ncbi:hypothetical protein UT300009_30720 [Paraclostridium bifermentans]
MKTRCNKCRKLIDYGNTYCSDCESKVIKDRKDNLKDKEAEKAIKSERWKKVRIRILQRDKTCVLCKKRKRLPFGKLSVHHIVKRTDDLSLAFEPTNLVTVCGSCHEELEKLSPQQQKALLGIELEELEFYL